MTNSFSQPDLEKLSAWMDGELAPEQELEVRKLVSEDPSWAQAYRQLQETDEVLDHWKIPATPDYLAARIIRNSKPKHLLLRVVKWASPLAAAAVIVLMILVMQQSKIARTRGVAKSGAMPRSQQTRPGGALRYRVPSSQEQARLLENYSKRMQFEQQWLAHNEWLLVVLRSFTPEEVKVLEKLPQDEVSRRIIQRRDKLVKQGILKRILNSR